MNQSLFIIGNGFDMFHGIKSGYPDFKEFVKKTNKKLFEALENYFDSDSLWSYFEDTLAYLDTDKIIENASGFLVDYSAEEWSDAYHHDYQYEVQQAINVVTVQLRIAFTSWILNLKIPYHKKLTLPQSAKYINFNYTHTLEKVYEIPCRNILYIHNKAINMDSILILGHGRPPITKEDMQPINDDPNDYDDVRVTDGNKILDKYFVDTYKNTETIMQENISFFANLKIINKVFVLGHSMSEVDINYFHKIKESIPLYSKWIVSYRNDTQIEEKRKTLSILGIDDDLMDFIKLEDLSL